MALQRISEEVIKLVEEASGLPVVVHPDPKLTTPASIRIARPADPAHFLTYNPTVLDNMDYAVVYQCGFVLRIFKAKPSERYDLTTNYRGGKDVEKMVNEHKDTLAMNREGRLALAERFYKGLIQQLRSIPTGLRVDGWIRQSYPDLADQQRVSINRQLNDNTKVLGPEVRKLAPTKVFEASVAMNAAFALFWSKTWNEPPLLTPYRVTARLGAGEKLLAIWDEIPDDPDTDKKLIDAWGENLGIKGWYEFLPRA